jgi:hypothetical protein
MTPVNLDEIERLAKAATLGPWKYSPQHVEEGPSAVYKTSPFERWLLCTTSSDDDAAFIAALNPKLALALVARIRELEAEKEHDISAVIDHIRTCRE